MALAADDPQADGEFLDDIEDRNENELQQQQPVSPFGAALRRGDDAAGIRIGEHDDNAGTGHERKAQPVLMGSRV